MVPNGPIEDRVEHLEDEERRATDGLYHFAMKMLAFIGAIVTLITLPLIMLIYNQVDRRVTSLESDEKAIEKTVARHEADQNLIISKERMQKIETTLENIQADVTEVKLKVAEHNAKDKR